MVGFQNLIPIQQALARIIASRQEHDLSEVFAKDLSQEQTNEPHVETVSPYDGVEQLKSLAEEAYKRAMEDTETEALSEDIKKRLEELPRSPYDLRKRYWKDYQREVGGFDPDQPGNKALKAGFILREVLRGLAGGVSGTEIVTRRAEEDFSRIYAPQAVQLTKLAADLERIKQQARGQNAQLAHRFWQTATNAISAYNRAMAILQSAQLREKGAAERLKSQEKMRESELRFKQWKEQVDAVKDKIRDTLGLVNSSFKARQGDLRLVTGVGPSGETVVSAIRLPQDPESEKVVEEAVEQLKRHEDELKVLIERGPEGSSPRIVTDLIGAFKAFGKYVQEGGDSRVYETFNKLNEGEEPPGNPVHRMVATVAAATMGSPGAKGQGDIVVEVKNRVSEAVKKSDPREQFKALVDPQPDPVDPQTKDAIRRFLESLVPSNRAKDFDFDGISEHAAAAFHPVEKTRQAGPIYTFNLEGMYRSPDAAARARQEKASDALWAYILSTSLRDYVNDVIKNYLGAGSDALYGLRRFSPFPSSPEDQARLSGIGKGAFNLLSRLARWFGLDEEEAKAIISKPSTRETQMRFLLTNLFQYTIYQRTGKQLNQVEMKQVEKLIPDLKQDSRTFLRNTFALAFLSRLTTFAEKTGSAYSKISLEHLRRNVADLSLVTLATDVADIIVEGASEAHRYRDPARKDKAISDLTNLAASALFIPQWVEAARRGTLPQMLEEFRQQVKAAAPRVSLLSPRDIENTPAPTPPTPSPAPAEASPVPAAAAAPEAPSPTAGEQPEGWNMNRIFQALGFFGSTLYPARPTGPFGFALPIALGAAFFPKSDEEFKGQTMGNIAAGVLGPGKGATGVALQNAVAGLFSTLFGSRGTPSAADLASNAALSGLIALPPYLAAGTASRFMQTPGTVGPVIRDQLTELMPKIPLEGSDIRGFGTALARFTSLAMSRRMAENDVRKALLEIVKTHPKYSSAVNKADLVVEEAIKRLRGQIREDVGLQMSGWPSILAKGNKTAIQRMDEAAEILASPILKAQKDVEASTLAKFLDELVEKVDIQVEGIGPKEFKDAIRGMALAKILDASKTGARGGAERRSLAGIFGGREDIWAFLANGDKEAGIALRDGLRKLIELEEKMAQFPFRLVVTPVGLVIAMNFATKALTGGDLLTAGSLAAGGLVVSLIGFPRILNEIAMKNTSLGKFFYQISKKGPEDLKKVLPVMITSIVAKEAARGNVIQVTEEAAGRRHVEERFKNALRPSRPSPPQ